MKILLTNTADYTTPDIYFVMLPESITCETATNMISYDIMQTGEAKRPLGEELTSFSWSGTLPGKKRKGQPYLTGAGAWIDPVRIQEILSYYRVNGTKLRLIITGTPINHYVYLSEFKATYSGHAGDIAYDIKFEHAKDVTVLIDGSVTANRSRLGGTMTYTVKTGDSLWSIAQKEMGNGEKYTVLYDVNQKIIDAENQRQGCKERYMVYAGEVLNIPG